MEGGEVVPPDASLISGISAVIEPTDGGELVRVPGTRKPVETKPPPEPRGQQPEGLGARFRRLAAPLLNRVKALVTGGSAANGDESSSTESSEVPPNQRPVRCFDCGYLQYVSRVASSTQCGRCSVYISLEDYEITSPWSQNIHTRGDVVVGKKGSLGGCDVACHHLTVLGKLSASVDCSGNATFRGPSRVLGSMYCSHLRVEKKCQVSFPQGVVAKSADIYGEVDGNIVCSGTIRIFKSGSVQGDATASAVELKDGGVLSGKMDIQHDIEIPLPPKKTRRAAEEDDNASE